MNTTKDLETRRLYIPTQGITSSTVSTGLKNRLSVEQGRYGATAYGRCAYSIARRGVYGYDNYDDCSYG